MTNEVTAKELFLQFQREVSYDRSIVIYRRLSRLLLQRAQSGSLGILEAKLLEIQIPLECYAKRLKDSQAFLDLVHGIERSKMLLRGGISDLLIVAVNYDQEPGDGFLPFVLEEMHSNHIMIDGGRPAESSLPVDSVYYDDTVQISTLISYTVMHGTPSSLRTLLSFGAPVDSKLLADLISRILVDLLEVPNWMSSGVEILPDPVRHNVAKMRVILRNERDLSSAVIKARRLMPNISDDALHRLFKKFVPKLNIQVDTYNPSSLLFLCKGLIRKRLYESWQLPTGIETLEIPLILKEYLSLKD